MWCHCNFIERVKQKFIFHNKIVFELTGTPYDSENWTRINDKLRIFLRSIVYSSKFVEQLQINGLNLKFKVLNRSVSRDHGVKYWDLISNLVASNSD